MASRSILPRLVDIVEAIERIRSVVAGRTLEQFEAEWQLQWLVVRGLEIISEASRHLPETLKERHGDIPWRKVADIGNVLRHRYEIVAPAVIWKLVEVDLPDLARVCHAERIAAEYAERGPGPI
jgi:uncharacterized protein with HEPN domain